MSISRGLYALLFAVSLCGCMALPQKGNIAISNNDAVIRDFPHAIQTPDIIVPYISNIAFGSCAPIIGETKIYETILASSPDLFLMLGDNIYGDYTPSDPQMSSMRASYWQLAQNQSLMRLIGTVPTDAVWDDHDYGAQDAGNNFQYRALSERMFETFWNTRPDDERGQHEGNYKAFSHGEGDKRVQIILLDTRSFRDDPLPTDAPMARGRERYMPHSNSSDAQVLGAAQWQWLEEKLKEPAQIRIIVSSIQLVADGHGWEAWALFPAQRQKFYDLIGKTNAKGVIVISGDRHHASINVNRENAYPIYDFTSSPLSGVTSNPYRELAPLRIYHSLENQINFGQIAIDWRGRKLTLLTKGLDGQTLHSQEINFAEIGI